MPETRTITLEALSALAVTEVQQRHLEELPDLEELNRRFAPSPTFEEKVGRALRRVKRSARAKRWVKVGRRLLVAGMACVTLLSGTLLQANAVQEAVTQTIMVWQDKYVEVSMVTPEGPHRLTVPENVVLEYLPEDLVLADGPRYMIETWDVFYTGDGWRTLSVSIHGDAVGVGHAIDNEYTDFYTIRFGEQEALWYTSTNQFGTMNTLMWQADGLVYSCGGGLELSEVIKVAEGIRFG